VVRILTRVLTSALAKPLDSVEPAEYVVRGYEFPFSPPTSRGLPARKLDTRSSLLQRICIIDAKSTMTALLCSHQQKSDPHHYRPCNLPPHRGTQYLFFNNTCGAAISYVKVVRAISSATLLCITLQGSFLFGQASSIPDSVRFSVRVAPVVRTIDTLNSEVLRALHDILKTRAAVDTHTPDWLFFFGTKEFSQDTRNLFVLSITTLRVLPKEAVEVGKREEVFYSTLPAEKRAAMPKEGKWVREMVSEEMLRQYGMPVDQDILIVERSLLKKELSQFVDNFYLRLAHPNH